MDIELCAGTESAVRIARQFQLDRVELCQQLEIGGTTPSAGLQQFSQRLIETHVLIRPRGGDFVYSSDEKEVMLKDIYASASLGMTGVVVGALLKNNELDADWLKEAQKASQQLELTCHRAFDEVQDWQSSMETLISLGFKRILTSGQADHVLAGKEVLKSMKAFANGRIEIMAGGGVKADNVQIIRDFVKPDAIHFSGTSMQQADGNSRYAVDLLLPNIETIAAIVGQIRE